MVIPNDFPRLPPEVSFIGPKLVMECVTATGQVVLDKIEIVDISKLTNDGMVESGTGKKFKWDPQHTLADVLVAIRNNMHLKSVCTPSGSISQQTYA